jgi:hypothetical protein
MILPHVVTEVVGRSHVTKCLVCMAYRELTGDNHRRAHQSISWRRQHRNCGAKHHAASTRFDK